MDGNVADKDPLDAPLPALRDDLTIEPTAPLTNGAPAWVIFDPVANRYFEIGRELFDMLTMWRTGTARRIMKSVRHEFGHVLSAEDIAQAAHFLISNALVRDIPGNDYAMMAAKAAEERKSWMSSAMHSYLFFRIPLFRPDRFLRRTWPFVAFLFTRLAVFCFVLMGIAGLYLVSRQWEHFSGTFQYMLSWEGAVFYGISLVIVKSLHELGHAYMAVRFGLRVPTIGIAFMVLMPVLYTDTSGAWRLKSRRQRLMIDGAGIFTELALACTATLIWVFLPDGGVRLCFFAIATTSWVTSLFVNLNPLMRFDGYYILADTLGFQNLQNRGFEMARWRLRELLFGLGEPAPELLSRGTRRIVILHAWATWIYRFFLFLGIALIVYAFFIKVVGIILFVIEIVWFILAPVGRELKHWWSIRSKIMSSPKFYVSLAMVVALIFAAFLPLSTRVSVPAVLTAQQEQRLYAPFPARVVSVDTRRGEWIEKGEVVLRLEAPQLDLELKNAEERRALLGSRIDRTGSDAQDRASLVVLTNELAEIDEKIDGLKRVSERLVMRAPFAGRVVELDSELHSGLWVNTRSPLGLIQSREGVRIKGYVPEINLLRFNEGARARFVPDNPEMPMVDALVKKVAIAGAAELDQPYLALRHGGPIATEEGDPDVLKPVQGQYAVALAPTDRAMVPPAMAVRGVALVDGSPESFFDRVRRRVLKVLVREMGV